MSLTESEQRQFTFLNLLAFDFARKTAAETNTRIPAFLCASEEAKVEWRKNALDVLNTQVCPIIPFDDGTNIATVENFIQSTLGYKGEQMMQAWINAETMLKGERENHNPVAFFV